MPWWAIVLIAIGALVLSVIIVICYWVVRMLSIDITPFIGWKDDE